MTRLRFVLGPVAAVWLVCQATTLTVAPGLLWFGSTDVNRLACTCAHGIGATCPMHHRTTGHPKVCAFQSMATSATAVLRALFSSLGLVPDSSFATVPPQAATSVRLSPFLAKLRPSPPDPPPPRA
jgi:hypothetical protein